MKKGLPKVLVIMSTFNGEKYLKEQIDSILKQKNVDLTLYISDDCSKDKTVEIIKEYQKKYNNIILHINEKNKNFTYNFLDSVFEFKNSEEFDYYAFSDQDDVWLEEKLIAGINKIKQVGENTLYCSNLKIVDENLKQYDIMNRRRKKQYKSINIISKNIATGCTMIFDKGFKNIVTQYYPNNIYLHDYWLAVIACLTKDCHFIYSEDDAFILYRQHSNNLIGQNKDKFKKLNNIIWSKYNYDLSTLKLINQYIVGFESVVKDEYIQIINRLQNYRKFKNKLYFLLKFKTLNKISFKVKILFNKY
ncbi:MAG: glycosyltransferase family 2 protein [Clostridia bacterium]|nr:glycosyltransferase family 2 protein [Clostridia bacterium]